MRRIEFTQTMGIIATVLVGLLIISFLSKSTREPQPSSSQDGDAAASTLVYVSDYFSFIGEDDSGHVVFALDNNRGRDGDAWQAEHFVALHDEQQGWTELAGNGEYDNLGKQVLVIPDSPFFQFQGTPATGITIISPPNDVTLRVDPIPERLSQEQDEGRYWMGASPAVLDWAGRTLKGRVIYEYLFMPDFNRLTRRYLGLWKEFQGLYASVEGKGDLYVHSQQSPWLTPLVGELAGFAMLDEHPEKLDDLQLNVLSKTQALGFYRWPMQWQGRWAGREGPGSVAINLSDLKVISNWIIGGFALGIIQGEVDYNGRKQIIYGLAELLI